MDLVALSTFITLQDISDSPVGNIIADARAKGYDTISLPLTTQSWKQRWSDMCLLPPGGPHSRDLAAEARAEAWRANPRFLHDEVTISRLEEADGVVVIVSDWLDLDASDPWVRYDSEIALQQELSYASHLDLRSAILPPPRNRAHVDSYARAVNSCLQNTPYINISVRLPVYDPSVFDVCSSSANSRSSITSKMLVPIRDPSPPMSSHGHLNATWEMWDVIRSICDYNPRLTLTLDLTPPLPLALGALSRWAAESVRFLLLPSSTFIANTKGYPVLPKGTQSFIRDSMAAKRKQHRPTVILSGVNPGVHSRGGEAAYSQYVRHLEKTSSMAQAAQKVGTLENFTRGYGDYLQAPLQPLMDNLQSTTYHIFEQDPVKYKHYEEAMYLALKEWPKKERIVLCIAGAGRGPLVARGLKAIERSHREAFIYAVEKNPNAFVTLQGRQQNEWGERVKILFGDMRFIPVPEKVDILVTELLGSFGDNELSPECLDGAMRFLKSDGISIPSSYTAHLAPLSSAKLYQEARSKNDQKCVETPYVVMFEEVNILSGSSGGDGGRCGSQIQTCWEFEHPRKDAVLDDMGLPLTNSHNVRSAKLTFHIPHAGVLHGLAGYFEAVLYGGIGLSTHPRRKDRISKDMLSWFPLFFPFREPLYLPSNSELQVSIWRLTNQRQVWYEWYAESFLRVSSNAGAVTTAPGDHYPLTPPRTASLFASHSDPVLSVSELERMAESSLTSTEVVKIGQTSLHNPGGRSSWIGL